MADDAPPTAAPDRRGPLLLLALTVVAGGLAAWLLLGGGLERVGLAGLLKPRAVLASTAAPTEVCAIAIAGSNTVGERLAPEIVASFLAYNGYPAGPAESVGPTTVRLVGVKGERTCTVEIRSKGSSTAFEALADGSALIGMASRAIKDSEIAALNAAGAGDFAAEAADAEHVIALDGIAVIANPAVKVNALSKRDVARIYLGGVREWRSLGGGTGTISRYARSDASGTFQFFAENVLAGDARWAGEAGQVKRFDASGELVSAVAADPAGIGFVGVAYVTPEVKVLSISDGGPAFKPDVTHVRAETYPIARRLYLYTRPDTYRNHRFVHALVDYFKSPAAYDIVERLKYISLRASAAAAAPEAPQACAPDTPETAAYAMATRGAERLPAVIRFRATSTDLDSLARDDLERVAPLVRQAIARGDAVRLVGHSDDEGDAARNRRLALERAQALRVELERLSVLGVQVESAGEMCPVASNNTGAGRQTNRRVEIWIVRGGA
ncbi:MAG: phosphate ABC transporter substrate-binding/OmpA family protein [Hyphomonadaceae bacterium]|nr:phosphate ABC transporter substrate-binding/OmpA family protein [Hyphomonadaceae bacterium]